MPALSDNEVEITRLRAIVAEVSKWLGCEEDQIPQTIQDINVNFEGAENNYRDAIADWAQARADATDAQEALKHTVRALASLTGVELVDDATE